MCFRGTNTVSGHYIIVCVLGDEREWAVMYNSMCFRAIDSERSCKIICVLGEQKHWAFMYNSVCLMGSETMRGHV